MKKLFLMLATVGLMIGCVSPQQPSPEPGPPMPPMPPKAKVKRSAKTMLANAPLVPPVPPSWTFTNLYGTYQIDTSTNLTVWWPTLVVYDVTNLTLTADSMDKYPILFFRLKQIE